MKPRSALPFLYSAGILLLIAGGLRFAILLQDTHASRLLLKADDPVFGLKIRHEVWVVMAVEIITAGVCFWQGKLEYRLLILACVITNYFVFQIGQTLLGFNLQNSCVGNLTDPLHLSRGVTGYFIKLVPYYLMLGTYWFLISQLLARMQQISFRKRAQLEAQSGVMKISCHACGGRIRFDSNNIGQQIACPHCCHIVTLRSNDYNLKLSCYFCKGNIEFLPHALGRKISCPHCNMEITLIEK